MKRSIFLLCLLVLMSGCATDDAKRALYHPEKQLRTDGETTMLFHSILYYPSEISLKFPGYIIGIEKSPVRVVANDRDIIVGEVEHAGLDRREARNEIVDQKILYISHIIKNNSNEYGLDNCAIYNAYNQPGDAATQQLVPNCQGRDVQPLMVAPKDGYKSSWLALDALAKDIKNEIDLRKKAQKKPYTHIVVTIMGWNTLQDEAVRNFNSLIKNIKSAGGDNFTPLFIGVTWPSQWQNQWLEPIYKFLSFPVKAKDADEVGLSWLGVLVHDTLPKVKGDLPVVILGHSFGARAATVAACAGPAIHKLDTVNSRYPFENITLIALQGAFLTDRLLGNAGDRFIQFHDQCSNMTKIYLTSSIHDQAMDMTLWGVYAGNDKSFKKYCDGSSKAFNCVRVTDTGDMYIVTNNNSKLTYIDADSLVYQNAYLSGGGAHSDIYRKEHGKMIWDLIR